MRTWAEIPARHRTAYKPCPKCGEPCGRKSSACVRCSELIRGKNHYAWKGDDALTTTKRERAQKRYQLGPCERCGTQATDRHHKDGDTGNNAPDNIAILCRRCHMAVDGRLDRFKEVARQNHARNVRPPRPCVHCGREYKPLTHGRCHACYEYRRRHGFDRPLRSAA